MKNCKNQDPTELQVRDKINVLVLNSSGKNSFVEYRCTCSDWLLLAVLVQTSINGFHSIPQFFKIHCTGAHQGGLG